MYTSRPLTPVVRLTTELPEPLGAAAVGVALDTAARADHIHALPSAAGVGAAPSVHTHAVTALTGTPTSLAAFDGVGVGTDIPVSLTVENFLGAADAADARTEIGAASTDYVDAAVGGLLYKAKCRVAVIANVASLSGAQTLDGVALVATDRVLLTGQIDPTENGPWVVQAGAWTRAAASEFQACAAFPIDAGTYEGHIFYIATNDPITPGVTTLTIPELKVNVSSSQIVDASSSGLGVLTGATPGDGRTALGLLDGVHTLPLFAAEDSSSATPRVVGFAGFTPAAFVISGRTTVLTLDAVGQVSGAGLTGTLEVLDSADTVVASIDWIETVATRKTAAIALPGSPEIYRARVSCAGITDPVTEYTLLGGANLRITWS